MLAVAAFVAFWVIVALGLVLIAARAGGARPSRGAHARAASRSAITLFVATAAVFGIALPILMLDRQPRQRQRPGRRASG